MQFQPKQENDCKKREFPLLPKGVYPFEIFNGEDAISQNNNDMIKLRVGIWGSEKIECYVFDYLLSTEGMMYKLRHACDACGLIAKYESGQLHGEDFVGRTGKCKISIQKGKNNYPDKNVIDDYVLRAAKPIAGQATQTNRGQIIEEDLPF